MIALCIAVLSAGSLIDGAQAQNYTVHSSFIFANTGDRTPLLDTQINPTMTNLGAQQMYNLGAYFRRRYITSGGGEDPFNDATVLNGLNSWKIDNDQIFVTSIDSQYTTASAEAFMQALYPPYSLGSSNASSVLDQSALTSNNTYITAPLGGYQYPTINTVSQYDPFSIYITGTMGCDNFEASALAYYDSESFNATDISTRTMYQNLGHALLGGVLPQDQWGFGDGYLIYDYLSYMYNHNAAAYDILTGPGYLDGYNDLHALASQKQWEIYGDQSVSGVFPGDKIRTIGGQALAARIVGLLSDNIGSNGVLTKFNLAVGEYDVMMALFSLMDLPTVNPGFEYLPPFASAMAFELFSYTNESTAGIYPSSDDLWVRFLYINGSLGDENPSPSIQAYSLFGRDPDQLDMRWQDFYSLMEGVGLDNVGDWCLTCTSSSIFCPALVGDDSTTSSSSSGQKSSKVTPAVAGVIGAIVTLVVAGILFALMMLIGGVRLYRNHETKKDLTGFRGSSKMTSDQDLHLPKNAAPIGIATHEVDLGDQKRGHERVGSWELENKQEERNTMSSLGGMTAKGDDYGAKYSFDEDRLHDGINPFTAPVNPRESV